MTTNENSSSIVLPFEDTVAEKHLNQLNQTIYVHVEDDSNVSLYIWEQILNKIKPKGYEISIRPMGSRNKVIERCKENQTDYGKRNLYIIDPDMDLLTKKRVSSLNNLFHVKGYCVENYLLEEDNLIELCKF